MATASTASLPRSHVVRFAQLAALWAYAVSQPVFSFLEGNEEFLVLRDATTGELIAFALLLAFGLPLLVVGYTALAGLVSRWVGDMLYVAALVAFFVPLAFQVVKPLEPGRAPSLLLVVALCAVAAWCYLRWRVARMFLTFSLVLPVLGLAWFVQGLPGVTTEARAARIVVASPHPVVVVVLDELPVSSLLRRDGQIDAVRYPGFARLAHETTWYANATTVHESTSQAVPAILTGKLSRTFTQPTAASHPESLFTFLGGDYSLFSHETVTRLCPKIYCSRPSTSLVASLDDLIRDLRAPYLLKVLPRSITDAGADAIAVDARFERETAVAVDDFDAFLAEISNRRAQNSLHVLHLLLPHHPWRLLPSGRRYGFASYAEFEALEDTLLATPSLAEQAQQRHLLQVGYTDVLLGRLLDRLEQVSLYDRAMLVVVADHGASFRSGLEFRRVGRGNFAAIASVPLFVKYPGQERGAIDPRAARTIDIVPTIADVLKTSLPWRVDGSSLLGPEARRSSVVVIDDDGTEFRAPLRPVVRDNTVLASQKAALFGEGSDSLYAIGAHLRLLGERVGRIRQASRTVRVHLLGNAKLRNVRTSSGFVPTHISGVVDDGQIGEGTELAVVVNGRVRALTRCFVEGGEQRFQALVPEAALHDGPNRVDVYAIEAGGTRLVHLGGTQS